MLAANVQRVVCSWRTRGPQPQLEESETLPEGSFIEAAFWETAVAGYEKQGGESFRAQGERDQLHLAGSEITEQWQGWGGALSPEPLHTEGLWPLIHWEISSPGLRRYIVNQATTISRENGFLGSDSTFKLWDLNLLEGTLMSFHLFLIMKKADSITGHASSFSWLGQLLF